MAAYLPTDTPSALGYGHISTVSYFLNLMMLLVTNAVHISAQSQEWAEEWTSYHGNFDQKGLCSASDKHGLQDDATIPA